MSEPANLPSFAALTGEAFKVKVVDIGANPIDGAPPYAGLLREGRASVLGFEPNPEALTKLYRLKGSNETYLPYAVGDGGRHTLKMCAAPGMTSLLEPNPDVLGLMHGFPQWGTVVAREEIDTVRLDDVADAAGIDLLKIDIQGGELMVFKNAPNRLADAVVIHTEVEFLPLYKDQPLFSDVDQFLRSQGFVFHRFFPAVSRMIQPMLLNGDIYAGMSQIVWADAIFVRDFTRLDLVADDKLLHMAAILHDCYQSLDLALHVLLAYDRRAGKSVASTYLSSLTGGAREAPAGMAA